MTLPPALLREQPTVVILLERAYVSQMLTMGEHGGNEGFTWFGPAERNILCPRENGGYIALCCSSVSLALGVLGSVPPILTSVVAFYSTRLQRLHCDIRPDRWPQGGWTPLP
jgi:hypothetical protein